jgi:hypothetical protein
MNCFNTPGKKRQAAVIKTATFLLHLDGVPGRTKDLKKRDTFLESETVFQLRLQRWL